MLALALPAADPAVELFVASHGMSQGISQTKGAQVIPRLKLRVGSVEIGGQWRNISSPLASGIAAFFVKLNKKVGRAQVETAISYRIRTEASELAVKQAWEFIGEARQSFGKAGVRVHVDYSPNEFGKGKSLYAEIGPSLEIGKTTRIFANFARRERKIGPDYTAMNVGITKAIGRRLTVDARYFATNKGELGEPFGGRFVLSGRLTL